MQKASGFYDQLLNLVYASIDKICKQPRLEAKELLPLVRACFMNDFPMPMRLEKQYQEFLASYKPHPNRAEKKGIRELLKIKPGLTILPCHIVDGCELDLYCPDLCTDKWPRGVVYELDGPFHDPAKDARRDAYLESTGLKVFRIDLPGKDQHSKL